MNHEHDNHYTPLKAGVITVSDTRTKETDKGGKAAIQYLKDARIEISSYEIVKDDKELIQAAVLKALESADAVITTGGTGVAQRDVTIEAVKPLIDKEMEGFGEIFRYLSYTEDIGPRAILSRAFCGTKDNKVIFSIPGSTGAVKLAMEKLITEQIFHITRELNK